MSVLIPYLRQRYIKLCGPTLRQRSHVAKTARTTLRGCSALPTYKTRNVFCSKDKKNVYWCGLLYSYIIFCKEESEKKKVLSTHRQTDFLVAALVLLLIALVQKRLQIPSIYFEVPSIFSGKQKRRNRSSTKIERNQGIYLSFDRYETTHRKCAFRDVMSIVSSRTRNGTILNNYLVLIAIHEEYAPEWYNHVQLGEMRMNTWKFVLGLQGGVGPKQGW